MTYNRSEIMKQAGRLMRLGWTRSDAMKAAWASAKADPLPGPGDSGKPLQQEAGLRAGLKRYGVDTERLAARAKETVSAIVAAVATRPVLLPPPARAIELTKGEDGTYRL